MLTSSEGECTRCDLDLIYILIRSGSFWDPTLNNFSIDEARDLVFSLLDRPWRALHNGWWMTPNDEDPKWRKPQSGRGPGNVIYFLHFGTPPSITFQWMKLETFSLLDRSWRVLHSGWWMTPKEACPGSRDLHFWDTLHNFWMEEARHFLYSSLDRLWRVIHNGRWMITPKWVYQGSHDLLLKFWDPALHNFWTDEARHFVG